MIRLVGPYLQVRSGEVPLSGDRFGLRKDTFGSPIHIGCDTAATPDPNLYHPTGGPWKWEKVGGDFGTLLRMYDKDHHWEVQVAHTDSEHGDGYFSSANKGEPIPLVKVGANGLARGAHAHTCLIMPVTAENLGHLRALDIMWIEKSHVSDEAFITEHCEKSGLEPLSFRGSIIRQIASFGIVEAGHHYVVRSSIPKLHYPEGWQGPIIYLDIEFFGSIA